MILLLFVLLFLRNTNTLATTCVDTLETSPLCLFGNICSCADLIQTYACGTEVVSPQGNGSTPVNDICAQTCDVCDDPQADDDPKEEDCVDTISKTPLCIFANQCSCTDLIPKNPCGSEIPNPMGNITVNDICAQTCNACKSTTDDPAEYTGPVSNNIPLGIFDGLRSKLEYEVSEDKIKFKLTFPTTSAWTGFQFYAARLEELDNPLLNSVISGYECIVSSDDISGVSCRARTIRHHFIGGKLPDSSLASSGIVAACTPEMGKYIYEKAPYCLYDESDLAKTSTIITTGFSVMVTDVNHEIDTTYTVVRVGDYYEATWTRTREYPAEVGVDRMMMRWAVSPKGASDYVVNDLYYHGKIDSGKWVRGNDYFYLTPEAEAAATVEYSEDANVNKNGFRPGQFEALYEMFSVDSSNENGGFFMKGGIVIVVTAIVLQLAAL